MIGRSLSFCVQDILRGRVAREDVEKIVAGTTARTEEDWAELVKMYQRSYWRDFPVEAAELVRELRAQGRIEQPRLDNPEVHSIADGHWIKDGKVIRRL
ncbi:MAG: hypothetical protein HZC02_02815 [Candidatus Levybacteria bacterium]|nr:hypothetical protein [Candidatus Levybacteria bacterium]